VVVGCGEEEGEKRGRKGEREGHDSGPTMKERECIYIYKHARSNACVTVFTLYAWHTQSYTRTCTCVYGIILYKGPIAKSERLFPSSKTRKKICAYFQICA
jgi:hypothetical protein